MAETNYNNKQKDVNNNAAEAKLLNNPFAFISIHFALKAAIELNVFEILAQSGPPGTQLSASQIVSKIPTTNPKQQAATSSLYRILRFLSSYSFLTTSLPPEAIVEEQERLFGLTALTENTMVRGDGAVLPPMAVLSLFYRSQKEMLETYERTKFSVLNPEGPCPFEMAHGVGLYDYLAQRPPNSELTLTFDRLMGSSTETFFDSVIKVIYRGFDEMTELTDVGGNDGSALARIISVYPNIKSGINFDLPRVISQAPPLEGVRHVAGDMYQAVPDSKNIMLKWILHNWGDEECVKLLENCWKALPEGGKVIVLELVIADDWDRSAADPMVVTMDFHMLVTFGNGKERTVSEFRNLASTAGFSSVNVVPIENGIYVLEYIK